MKKYSGLAGLPRGDAPEGITPGCLVLEGGAWRGLYTQGAIDALLEAGINFQTVIGVSAGAMSSIGYMSGQIGLCPRFNLTYRHHPMYVGIGSLLIDHGITGFTFCFRKIKGEFALNKKRFYDPRRRHVVVVTNCLTGEAEYPERGKDRIFRNIRASATVPYVSLPVMINGTPYLDGGIAEKIPYSWALENGYDKIMVIRTREASYRREKKKSGPGLISRILYRKYPGILRDFAETEVRYNATVDRIDSDAAAGKTFSLAPSQPVTIKRFEGDLEKLGELYHLGYEDAKRAIPAIREYLAK
ncbi:MAG: patatin family protein [Lachnospiraceae bacterium]|nr:patatin family protein [Lachnospiraceae bacterium]